MLQSCLRLHRWEAETSAYELNCHPGQVVWTGRYNCVRQASTQERSKKGKGAAWSRKPDQWEPAPLEGQRVQKWAQSIQLTSTKARSEHLQTPLWRAPPGVHPSTLPHQVSPTLELCSEDSRAVLRHENKLWVRKQNNNTKALSPTQLCHAFTVCS